MPFPSYKEIEIPLLLNVYDNGGRVRSSSCYEPLGRIFNLTNEEMVRLRADGTNRPHWHNMVLWARKSLVDQRHLHKARKSGNGIWELTDVGARKAEALATKIDVTYPEDVLQTFFEGAVKQINVNKYERSRTARDKCIDHYGHECNVCCIDFEKTYGEIGKDYIHVHHIIPISKVGELYQLDPVRDLRPICPNCHSMIHRRTPPFTIRALKKIIRNSSGRASIPK